MIIDYARISAAEAHYQAAGFELRSTPWIVGLTAYNATKPAGAVPFVTLGGYLVASAEQSYLELMLGGEYVGRAVTTTPCFRHEDYDELHHPYFMKVELVDTLDTSDGSLHRMIAAAQEFFEHFVPTKLINMENGTWDLVEASKGIELGSYGRRQHQGQVWLYGTGLAEPRLAQAMAAQL